MVYDCLVVGAGMAGLTAAAYVSGAGLKVLVLEKEQKVGGLVNSFEKDGFRFDGGIRALENSGIIFPMLRQLGIELEMVRNDVTIGIGSDTVRLTSKDSLGEYEALLARTFPGYEADVRRICGEIAKVMQYMDVLYGIDNPLFLDLKKDTHYLYKTILPWMVKYALTMPKVGKLNMPVSGYLSRLTGNQALIDMIAQHFFKATPTFFALSYFSLYLDYRYPLGGTGSLSGKMRDYTLKNGGEIRTGTEVVLVDPARKSVRDAGGNEYGYRKLIWAADMKRLYSLLDESSLEDSSIRSAIDSKRKSLVGKTGGDSILTLYVSSNLDTDYFARISSPHFFYTPDKRGMNALCEEFGQSCEEGYGWRGLSGREELSRWVHRYLELTTYEISIPAMRDKSMAPEGKTGLIISSLMDYGLVERIRDEGWYEEFKKQCEETILEVLSATVYPELKDSVIGTMTSTPLTLAKMTGNTEGAITGWAFTNKPVPAVNSLPRIARSIDTPIPDVIQAGQWVFSPSGLPTSILTGKLAADRAIKRLKGGR